MIQIHFDAGGGAESIKDFRCTRRDSEFRTDRNILSNLIEAKETWMSSELREVVLLFWLARQPDTQVLKS